MIQRYNDSSEDPIPLPLNFDELATPSTDRSHEKPVRAPQHVQSSVTPTHHIQHQASGRSPTVPRATPPGTPIRFSQPVNRHHLQSKNYFSTTALIKLYHAFIVPYLIYCVEVWGNALSKHVQPLIKLQNKILKIITPSHRFINKEQLYAHSGIIPFNLLVKHKINLLMYKLSDDNIPKPLLNIYKSNKEIHTHFTKQANHFRSRRGNPEFVYRTFAFQSVFILNKIIQNIDINVHITRFKHLLKGFLLSNDISFRYTK